MILLQSRNRDKCMNTKGGVRWDELGDGDWHVYTIETIYKILTDNWWEPTVEDRELYSMLCDNLNIHQKRGCVCVYIYTHIYIYS